MDRNTSPISPFLKEDYVKAYEKTAANLYPADELLRFKKIYSQLNDFQIDEIELANGSDEWIQKLMITLGKRGVMTLTPDFVMYEVYAKQMKVPFYQIKSDQHFDFDFTEVIQKIKQIKPSLFIVSNPHNPTGRLFSEKTLNQIAQAMKEVGGYFVIDEAYIEFAQDYNRPKGEHIILLRTLSKIYGMAGLRIGVIQALNETYQKITSINHPYPLNHLNLNLASEFLEEEDRRLNFLSYQKECQTKLIEAFQLVEDKVIIKPSTTNFVFTYGQNARNLGIFLREKGFSGRFYEEDNLRESVRYSILALEQYPGLTKALTEWKNQIGG